MTTITDINQFPVLSNPDATDPNGWEGVDADTCISFYEHQVIAKKTGPNTFYFMYVTHVDDKGNVLIDHTEQSLKDLCGLIDWLPEDEYKSYKDWIEDCNTAAQICSFITYFFFSHEYVEIFGYNYYPFRPPLWLQELREDYI